MGFISDAMKAVDDYSRRHKEHMTQQWERQAEKAKASEPRPLTETQLAWHKLQQERAQLEHQQQQQHQPIIALQQQQEVAAAAARPSATPVYTITWQVRLTSLSNIPLPWAAN